MTCLQFYTFSTEAECGQTLFGHDKLITRKPPGKEIAKSGKWAHYLEKSIGKLTRYIEKTGN